MDPDTERRTQRSPELQQSLKLLLSAIAQRSGVELLVLSTEDGALVAANPAGTDPERLRARVPASETAVLPLDAFRHDDQPLYLWARGQRGAARVAVSEAEQGLRRILNSHFF